MTVKKFSAKDTDALAAHLRENGFPTEGRVRCRGYCAGNNHRTVLDGVPGRGSTLRCGCPAWKFAPLSMDLHDNRRVWTPNWRADGKE